MTDNEFKEKIQSIQGMLYRTAKMYLDSRSLALDVLDETVYRALCSHRKVKSPEHFDSWMIQILMRECYRKLRRLKKVCSMEELSETAFQEFDALPLKEAVRSLPGDLKDILILTYFSGLSLADTAQALNIPQETASLRQRKALHLLRLETEDEAAGRYQEYLTLMKELEKDLPDLQESVKKALARRFRHRFLFRPASVAAVCFILFTASVNLSFKAAYTCSQVPGIRKLAAAVDFSTPLWDVLDNDYVQTVNLTQSQNEITAHISHLIVDNKQIKVYLSVSSSRYKRLNVYPDILSANGDWYKVYENLSCAPTYSLKSKELHCMTIGLLDNKMPSELHLHVDVEDSENARDSEEVTYVAQFDFLLEPDPPLTEEKKIFPIDRTLELDGQEITIRQIEVYPTLLIAKIEEDPRNTSWLDDLHFNITTDRGKEIFAPFTFPFFSDSIYEYWLDSVYFYGLKHLNLVITGADWKSKDIEKSWVNLQTGETKDLPPGVSLKSARKKKNGSGWIVKFLWTPPYTGSDEAPQTEPFDWNFFDMNGNEYSIGKSTSKLWSQAPDENTNDTYLLRYSIPDYPYDEIYFSPDDFNTWTSNEEIVVNVK